MIIADLNLEAAQIAASEIETKGGIAAASQVDIADEGSVKRLFEFADERFGPIDVLVNNAANREKAELFEMTLKEWDAMQLTAETRRCYRTSTVRRSW